jgi:phosphoserine phosphatase
LTGILPWDIFISANRTREDIISTMPLQTIKQGENLYVVSVIGLDQVGIVSKVTRFLFSKGYNVVDIEQSVIHSQFTMVLLVQPIEADGRPARLKAGLSALAGKLKMSIAVMPLREYKGLRRAEDRKPYLMTILGTDKPGVVAALSGILAEHRCNIERIKMIARGELLAMEIGVDLREANFSVLRVDLSEAARRIGMDIVVQPESSFKKRKKGIVFDMDSTIVDGEMIDEMAKLAGVGEKVALLTERGMRGEIDFEESFRTRVSYLRGLKTADLETFAKTIKLTPGGEELIGALKEMGFKIALISGGFSYFTDLLRKRLGFDYAFGNELEIRNGRLTGKIKGRVIDARRKAEIMDEICTREGITRDEVVAVGDGSNDRIMVANAGLGIAFNAKEILKKVADGAITKEHMKGVLYCLGISDQDLKRRKERKDGIREGMME